MAQDVELNGKDEEFVDGEEAVQTEAQDEVVAMDNDSTDGAVLVNGDDADEE